MRLNPSRHAGQAAHRTRRALAESITAAALLLCVLAWAPAARARQTVTSATLGGRVEDSDGAALPGAVVTATNTETNQSRTSTTDGEGRYRFSRLAVGAYELGVEKSGFTTLTKSLTLTVGQALDVPLSLSVAGVAEDVQVNSADAPPVESGRTQLAETVTPKDVDSLPLNCRNYLDLALLLPGVSRTNTGSVQRFAETSAVPGTGISVAGQRNLANSFIVDGASADDDSVELAGTYYSQEVIREFQVVTSGAVAEFGRASGGFVNIVTQSGTNDVRGKAYGFLRNQRLDARNPLAPTRDPLTQAQYGASFGGPVRRNRTFFFGNAEQTRRNDSNVVTIAAADAAAINKRLRAVGYRGALVQTGLVPGGYDTTNLFARLDHQLDRGNAFTATYNFYRIGAVNARTAGGLNAVSRGTNLYNTDQTVNLQNVTTVGSGSLNELRFQFRRSRLSAPAVDPAGPAVNINGVASFGTATNSPTRRDVDLYQLSDNFSALRGNHSLKFGGEYLYNDLNIEFPGALQGVYTFTSLANFLGGDYAQFQQAFGAQSQAQKKPNVGLFARDEWKVRRDLTLNLGVRYDLQFLPGPVETDTDNVAPRFGFAYSPDGKTVVRGGLGLYYDRIPLRAVSNALQRDGTKYVIALLSRTSTDAPDFPAVLAARPSVLTTKPSVTRIDPRIESGSSVQASLQVERVLPWDSSVSVGYVRLRGAHVILSRNVNVPRCTAAADANRCRPDPNFGNVSRYEGSGESYYDGMVVSFDKRRGRWATARVSYTLSKTIDDAGNFFFSAPQDNSNLRGERGLSDNDQRHRLTLSGTFNSPAGAWGGLAGAAFGGLRVSYIFTYASRLPFNVLAGSDLNGDSNNNDRPRGFGRNTGRGFDFASFDLRLARRFSVTERLNLELMAEGFNLFNRANFGVPNNSFGTGATPLHSFGRPTAAFDPRQIQLGFRLNF